MGEVSFIVTAEQVQGSVTIHIHCIHFSTMVHQTLQKQVAQLDYIQKLEIQLSIHRWTYHFSFIEHIMLEPTSK